LPTVSRAFVGCVGRMNADLRRMRSLSPAVGALLALNALVFVVTLVAPEWGNRIVGWFAVWFPRHENAAWWQVVTYMFLHGGFTHVLFNMFGLVSFGPLLERQWGTARFLIFYFLCGIGAGLTQVGVNWIEFQSLHDRLTDSGLTASAIDTMLNTGRYDGPRGDTSVRSTVVELYQIYSTPMVGASGAIYGILVAFGLLYPNAKLALMFIPVPVAAKFVIPVILALDLFSGVTGFSLFGGGVAHWAHLGGALIGFILMWFWRKPARPSDEFGFRR
jgi:membrane associated rhomboid family serine protease